MFARMNGKQLAGWGYGIFWMGSFVELINALIGSVVPNAAAGPVFWVGVVLAITLVATGVRMLFLIHTRAW